MNGIEELLMDEVLRSQGPLEDLEWLLKAHGGGRQIGITFNRRGATYAVGVGPCTYFGGSLAETLSTARRAEDV